jgi:hypothetical protein
MTKMSRSNPLIFVVQAVLILVVSVATQAQDSKSAAENAENLKLQLLDLSVREDSAKLRAQQLDEALKPENIQLALAGVGSTRPEELREQRRRQLTIEKNGVTAELEILAAQRTRLETAIAAAESEAYQQSAQGYPIGNKFGLSQFPLSWVVTLGVLGMAALGAIVAILFKLRVVSGKN